MTKPRVEPLSKRPRCLSITIRPRYSVPFSVGSQMGEPVKQRATKRLEVGGNDKASSKF